MLYTGRHLCLHVLSDLPIDRPSNSLVGVPYSSRYDAHSLVFASNLIRGFSPPIPHWLRVRPDPLADRRPATDMASETLRIAPCITTHTSRPDSFQSTIMARRWRTCRYRGPRHYLCRGVYAHQGAATRSGGPQPSLSTRPRVIPEGGTAE
jgi:hypothetical protein